MADSPARVERILRNLKSVIKGKDGVLEFMLAALCADGHVLIEDVPGTGKTTLGKTLARSLEASFGRIQFTPDLLPTDIVGGMIFSANTGEFTFRPGPVFCNILLADEINRASPRTQSALLEAMSERQVTIEGRRYPLERPFLVVATQNPVEYRGTYPLPEAQLDRFAMRLEIGYPGLEEEIEIVIGHRERHPLDAVEPVAALGGVVEMQRHVREVTVDRSLVGYIAHLVRATRKDTRVRLGASPRASEAMYRCAQAMAFLRGRSYVLPDEIQELAVPVIAHRLNLDPKSRHSGVTSAEVVREIVKTIRVPV